ncbi:hypothetical protein ABVK25_003578 [Lepraria finkii]|uniref:Uncharacterized protein n=1 Tax=Lepraria finkii TaxID=1340010 RepID=A0ABR4BGH1_9LECA
MATPICSPPHPPMLPTTQTPCSPPSSTLPATHPKTTSTLPPPSQPRARHTPPQSQDLDDAMDMGASPGMTTDEDGMKIKTVPYTGYMRKASPGKFAPGEKSDFAKSAEMAEPGATWNNRKAREEYQRANMHIEDKDFNLREFGDPFDESQQGQENGKERGKQ